MGEAINRGNFEQRRAAAILRRKVTDFTDMKYYRVDDHFLNNVRSQVQPHTVQDIIARMAKAKQAGLHLYFTEFFYRGRKAFNYVLIKPEISNDLSILVPMLETLSSEWARNNC